MQKSQNQTSEAKFNGIFIKVEDHPCSHYEASNQALRELISQTRQKTIHKEYQDKFSDAEILGVLVSNFAKWDFNEIEDVTKAAFQDANFKVNIEAQN